MAALAAAVAAAAVAAVVAASLLTAPTQKSLGISGFRFGQPRKQQNRDVAPMLTHVTLQLSSTPQISAPGVLTSLSTSTSQGYLLLPCAGVPHSSKVLYLCEPSL